VVLNAVNSNLEIKCVGLIDKSYLKNRYRYMNKEHHLQHKIRSELGRKVQPDLYIRHTGV